MLICFEGKNELVRLLLNRDNFIYAPALHLRLPSYRDLIYKIINHFNTHKHLMISPAELTSTMDNFQNDTVNPFASEQAIAIRFTI